MNFNEYADKRSSKDKKAETLSPDVRDMFTKFLGSYEGKSEEELMKTIYKVAEANRKSGKLSDSEMEAFASMLAPMLDESKRKKLYALLEKLKKMPSN